MADVTAASFPIKLGDKEYRMSPLSDKDIVELDNWLKAQYVQMARDSLTDKSTQKEIDDTLRVAFTTARGLSWMTGDGAKEMSNPRGISRVVWQCLKKEHPELTHDDVQALILDPATIAYAMSVFDEVNFSDAMRRTTPQGSPKGRKRRLTRR